MKTDLHMHTTASDGTWTPEVLVESVKKAEIGIFAVTDHDTTENILTISKLAKENHLSLIPAVEISVVYQNFVYHIPSYGVDIGNQGLQDMLSANRKAAEVMNAGSIEYLVDKGHPVSLKGYQEYKNNRERGGWKALNYLIDLGLCQSYYDFFPLFKEIGNPLSQAEYVSPEKAFDVVKKAGGFPVLAHPGAGFYDPDYQMVIETMFEKGVMGIECYHPENSEEITEFALSFCKKNNLMVTGGSDCHGAFVKTRMLGKPDIRKKMLSIDKILRRINDIN